MHSATITLDNTGGDIQGRVSNQLYEWCRSGKMRLPNFPEFGPIVQAIKEGANPSSTKSYRVCTQQADRLLLLESLASKWIENEHTKERAEEEISNHNKRFNVNGDFWFADVSRTVLSKLFLAWVFLLCNWLGFTCSALAKITLYTWPQRQHATLCLGCLGSPSNDLLAKGWNYILNDLKKTPEMFFGFK